MPKRTHSFNLLLSTTEIAQLAHLAEQRNCSEPALIRSALNAAYRMAFQATPTCADGSRCFVNHKNILHARHSLSLAARAVVQINRTLIHAHLLLRTSLLQNIPTYQSTPLITVKELTDYAIQRLEHVSGDINNTLHRLAKHPISQPTENQSHDN